MAENKCLNCNKSEDEAPLVAMRYAGQDGWVCSGCLPVLIHKPEQMGAKLAAMGEG